MLENQAQENANLTLMTAAIGTVAAAVAAVAVAVVVEITTEGIRAEIWDLLWEWMEWVLEVK